MPPSWWENVQVLCCGACRQPTKRTARFDYAGPSLRTRLCFYFPVALNDSPFFAADGVAIIAPSTSSARTRHVIRSLPLRRWAGMRPVLAHSRIVRCDTQTYSAASRAGEPDGLGAWNHAT